MLRKRNLFVILLITLMILAFTVSASAVSSYEKKIAEINLNHLKEKYPHSFYNLAKNDRFNLILDKLEKQINTDEIKFKLFYIDTDVVNAEYIGNGYIVLYRGLLDLLQNDDQRAALLGHEMGHGIKKHLDENLQANLGLSLLVGFFNLDNKMLQNLALNLIQKGFSRDQEKEADIYSIQLLIKAGYNPEGAISLMKVLEKASNNPDIKLIELFQTHPYPSTRIDYMQNYLDDYRKQKAVVEITVDDDRKSQENPETPAAHQTPESIKKPRESVTKSPEPEKNSSNKTAGLSPQTQQTVQERVNNLIRNLEIHTVDGYSFKYPSNWIRFGSDRDYKILGSDDSSHSLTVKEIKSIASKPLNNNTLIEAVQQQPLFAENDVIKENKYYRLDGRTTYRVVLAENEGIADTRSIIYITYKDSSTFLTFNFMSDSGSFEDYSSLYDVIAASIEFK